MAQPCGFQGAALDFAFPCSLRFHKIIHPAILAVSRVLDRDATRYSPLATRHFSGNFFRMRTYEKTPRFTRFWPKLSFRMRSYEKGCS